MKKIYFLLLFFTGIQISNAQYMCTDIVPDSVISIPAGATLQLTYDIDVNNDNTMDFRFNDVQSGNAGFVIIQATQIGTNNAVLADGSNNALALTAGSPVAPSSTVWVQMNGSNQTMSQILFAPPTGPFPGMGDRYLGVRFLAGPNTHYGWIRFNFSNAVNSFTVKDYGYNATPNASIAAGQICVAVFSPSFSISGPVCPATSQTIVANTGTIAVSGYTWSALPAGAVIGTPNASATSISFTNSGTYSVTLSVNTGSISSSTQTILVNPVPSLSISTSNSVLCAGQTATVSASGATSYSWNTGATTSVIAVSPTSTAVYTLTGSNSFGCSSTSTFTQVVSTCAGLSQFGSNHRSFSVYPNPAHSEIHFAIDAGESINVSLEVLDLNGRILLNKNCEFDKSKPETVLDLSNLAQGMYFVRISNAGEWQIVKICIE